jgi:hypothetical protein
VRPEHPRDLARDLAQVRLDNALALFEEFVRATARHADAATLRGLERRFAERVQIQPSYWSQIKSRSRQIGERLARQFEQLCGKPQGWMDQVHAAATADAAAGPGATLPARAAVADAAAALFPVVDENLPRDADERFIVSLVLSYYRRHPQRARTRLLDLLGEVLMPAAAGVTPAERVEPPSGRPLAPGVIRPPAATLAQARDPEVEAQALWRRTQAATAPLKRRK